MSFVQPDPDLLLANTGWNNLRSCTACKAGDTSSAPYVQQRRPRNEELREVAGTDPDHQDSRVPI